jgi:hypothetical protein
MMAIDGYPNKSPSFEDFVEKGKRPKQVTPKIERAAVRWWLADSKNLPGTVMSHVAQIIQNDRGRIESYNTYARLYGTWTPTFWNGYQLANSGKPTAPIRDRLTYNIVQSCIDTLTSRIAQNKPKPMFLTQAGDTKLQRKAKKLDAFCYGLFYQNDYYKQAPKIFRDSCIYGEGILHSYAENGTVKHERVLPYELLTDYLESHYGPESTKSIFRIKNIDRTQLMEMYPENADLISQMTGTSVFLSAANKSVADTVTVIEAHRIKTGDKPGRHVIVTENAILLDEDYDKDYFPYAILRYSPRLYGFYAQGMAEQLVPLQVEINRTLISIQRSLYLGGTHKIFVKSGSKVIKSHFDNMIGTILEYAGDTAPQYVVPQLVQPEIYQHLENMIQKGYQLPGVSQLSASSLKPMGIDSGKALRAVDDIQVQRFQTIAQAYEDFSVQVARNDVHVAKQIYDEDGKLEVKVPGKRFIETINWKEVDLPEDDYHLQVYPVSKLPNNPEGRLATIQEMMGAGLLTPEAGKRLLDYPDLEAEENLTNASIDYLHKILDEIVDEGKYTAPEPFDRMDKARELALEYYAQGKLNNMAEDRLELLRQFMKQLDMLQQAAMTPPPGAGPVGPGGPPMGAPTDQPVAPPVNQMVPQATPGPNI